MDRNNDSVNATTSLPSSSKSSTAAAEEGMGEEQVQIYEELMMLINEQELPPLSNYIANELGAENEEGSWWESFDQDLFWDAIHF